ncbi:MAG: hypothetical protein AAGG08_12225, partial [Actinomycetota bacterium]
PAVGDDDLLALAFSTLPEPWQVALWHRHVDRETDDAVAVHLGRDPGDLDSLFDDARRGLVDAFFREYEALGPVAGDAAGIVPLLAGHHRGSLSEAEQRRVEQHLRLDRIGIARPPSPGPTSIIGDDTSSPARPLDPPALRPHDAVDSRRLLDLVSSLDHRLAPAIAPGVIAMSDTPSALPPPDAAAPNSVPNARPNSEPDDDGRRRRLVVIGAVAVVAVLAIAALAFRGATDDDVASSGSGDATEDTAGEPGDGGGDDVGGGDAAGGDAAGGDGVGDGEATTTSLALRPDAEGPLNTISLRLDGSPVQGIVASPEPAISVVASSPAPVLAGGTGTIDLAIVNAGDQEADAELIFELPRGIRFESASGAICDDPEDASPRCVVSVAANGAAAAAVTFRLETSIVGRLQVDGDVVEPLVTPISVTPDLVHSSVGRGDVIVVGNTVTSCAPGGDGIDCADVADGVGDIVNRWDVPIRFVGAASQFGLFNSSSAELEIPEGARIVEAHLYWSGDLDERGRSIPDDGRNTSIALGLPGGEVRTIEAGRVVLGDVDASQYLGSNVVTDLVATGGSGTYTVGNVQTVEVQGSYGAWALVVVFDHDDEPRRHRIVTRPFEWVAPEDEFGETYDYETAIPVPSSPSLTAELDVFALEGELGFSPETFAVAGEELGGDNPFDSTISGDRDPAEVNSLGVDIDTYDLVIDASDGMLPISATSARDGIRIAVLGLTVDLAS